MEKEEAEENLAKKRHLSLKVEDYPLTEDTTCGFGPFRGHFLQKFATKNCCIAFFSFIWLCQLSSFTYFSGTISTMEKRFKIPSKVTGIVTSGLDFSGLLTSLILSYWAGGGHRPRWIAFGSFAVTMQMLLTTLPHFLYGPGEEALKLTREYGFEQNITTGSSEQGEATNLCKGGETCIEDISSLVQPVILFVGQCIGGLGGTILYTVGLPYLDDNMKKTESPIFITHNEGYNLCRGGESCVEDNNSTIQIIILFMGQILLGLSEAIMHTAGISYLDDNLKKSESPIYISISFFIRMVGATIGFSLASACLKLYIAPSLTPIITNEDPRWMGAWWLGWVILCGANVLATIPIGLFPKVMPAAAAAKMIKEDAGIIENKEETFSPSFKDMAIALKRLLKNKLFFYNNLATIFYCVAEEPYWVYLAKYIETQYAQSASTANFATGTIGLGSMAAGMLLAGIIITKYKPSARTLASWNVVIGFITVLGTISYVFIDCEGVHLTAKEFHLSEVNLAAACNSGCGCEYASYSPICTENGETYISPCHAGCMREYTENGEKRYSECTCVNGTAGAGTATPGVCTVNCNQQFYIFISILAILRFAKAAGIASNFLVGIRCIDEKDKTLSMGFTVTLINIVFLPAPIFYGYLLDSTCLVWGKTCTGTGNCWVYDAKRQAILLNLTTSVLFAAGTLFDIKVWKECKYLKIFD